MPELAARMKKWETQSKLEWAVADGSDSSAQHNTALQCHHA
jgi:hypothetical protein